MRTKTRISGPLFFGFSDPVTMRALAELYTAEELAACVSGGTVPSATGGHSALERVVAELERTVEGMARERRHRTGLLRRPLAALRSRGLGAEATGLRGEARGGG